MAGRVEGKVAFITGAARGPGPQPRDPAGRGGRGHHRRRHLPRLRRPSATPGAPQADLAETVKAVEALDRRIVAAQADVRDLAALKAAVDDGVAAARPARHRLRQRRHLHHPGVGRGHAGRLAGHTRHQPDRRLEHLRGRRAAPDRARAADRSSPPAPPPGIKGLPFLAPYVAAKHGVVGIAGRWPTSWPRTRSGSTRCTRPAWTPRWCAGPGGLDAADRDRPEPRPDLHEHAAGPVGGARDISNAVLFLASDEARYVTGLEFTVDAGYTIR